MVRGVSQPTYMQNRSSEEIRGQKREEPQALYVLPTSWEPCWAPSWPSDIHAYARYGHKQDDWPKTTQKTAPCEQSSPLLLGTALSEFTCVLSRMFFASVFSRSVVSNSLWPHGLWPSRLLCPWGFSRQGYWNGPPCPPPGILPNPGIEPRSPTLWADSLPAEPPGKPMNTGVGSLSLLQGIFPTQKPNLGLLRCREILYQLSYQGSLSLLLINPLSVSQSWKFLLNSFFKEKDWGLASSELTPKS